MAAGSSSWSFICISSPLKQSDLKPSFDARVSVPPDDQTPLTKLPLGRLSVTIKVIPDPPINASGIIIVPCSGFEFRAAIQQRLHQTLVCRGCFVQLGGGSHFKVIEASPKQQDRKGTQHLALYRIVASTNISVAGEAQRPQFEEKVIEIDEPQPSSKKKGKAKKK